MITYEQIDTTTVKVFLERKHVGTMYENRYGWHYTPKNHGMSGDDYATLEACKASLEEQ